MDIIHEFQKNDIKFYKAMLKLQKEETKFYRRWCQRFIIIILFLFLLVLILSAC